MGDPDGWFHLPAVVLVEIRCGMHFPYRTMSGELLFLSELITAITVIQFKYQIFQVRDTVLEAYATRQFKTCVREQLP